MAKDHELDWLLTQLEAIPHIKRLRIHSRLPLSSRRGLPMRWPPLASSSLQVLLVNHINHANELMPISRCDGALASSGVTLLNQSVLLRGVNDNAHTLAA
jgi:L-lysine 2,3-aminomutase